MGEWVLTCFAPIVHTSDTFDALRKLQDRCIAQLAVPFSAAPVAAEGVSMGEQVIEVGQVYEWRGWPAGGKYDAQGVAGQLAITRVATGGKSGDYKRVAGDACEDDGYWDANGIRERWRLVSATQPAPTHTKRDPKAGEVWRRRQETEANPGAVYLAHVTGRGGPDDADVLYDTFAGACTTTGHRTPVVHFLTFMSYHAEDQGLAKDAPRPKPVYLPPESKVEYVAIPKPHTSSRCTRCGGPAYVGLLHVTCERVGGCKTEAERIGEPVVSRVSGANAYVNEWAWLAESPHQFVVQAKPGCERVCTSLHVDLLMARGITHGHHPTREGAIALWRERALAAERER